MKYVHKELNWIKLCQEDESFSSNSADCSFQSTTVSLLTLVSTMRNEISSNLHWWPKVCVIGILWCLCFFFPSSDHFHFLIYAPTLLWFPCPIQSIRKMLFPNAFMIKSKARSDGNVSWIDSIISEITATYKVSRLHAFEYFTASSSSDRNCSCSIEWNFYHRFTVLFMKCNERKTPCFSPSFEQFHKLRGLVPPLSSENG